MQALSPNKNVNSMKRLILAMVIVLSGCVNLSGNYSDPTHAVKIEQVEINDIVGAFKLINTSKRHFTYEHWIGQAGSPVAYCEDETGNVFICSNKVVMLEDKFFTHDAVLSPRETVPFTANISSAKRIGVQFYFDNGHAFEVILIWYELQPAR